MSVALLIALASPVAAGPAEDLIQRGVTLEVARDFDRAVVVYRELERIQPGTGLFLQARVAFQRKDFASAQELAKRAVPLANAVWKPLATLLYGDSLFATGQYRRAKMFFGAYRDQWPDIEIDKRIIACNKQLGLPERHGLR